MVQNITRRAYAATMTSEQQFMRMEAVFQGYFSHENQRKIACIGRNYKAHAEELGNALPKEPLWFDKPMSSLLAPGAPFRMVPGLYDDIHHELEMGVVIGMRGKDIKPENAMHHIAGYFVGLDMTNRKLQTQNKAHCADWTLAKGADGMAAVSEFVHKSAVPDLANVEIELRINDQVRQKGNTSLMIFDIPTQIADLSKYMELREGDIIFTGTPEGVGQVFAGDRMWCAIRNAGGDDLVTLSVDVV